MVWTNFKRICLLGGVLIFLTSGLHAQTWSEWFSQKKTQEKYLLEQVAALKLYAGYLKKGYEIGSAGLNFIKSASKGEFDLHDAFFNSLKMVSPAVRQNPKIWEIVKMQVLIVKIFASLNRIDELGEQNQVYANLVQSNLSTECLVDIEELLLIITSGKIEMSDDERMSRIEKLYLSMETRKIFALRFFDAAQSLANERSNELKNLKKMEGWYENN